MQDNFQKSSISIKDIDSDDAEENTFGMGTASNGLNKAKLEAVIK